MADKPIYLVSGVPTERELIVTSAGAGDSGKAIALDAAGLIDTSMMPVGIGADTAAIVASEILAAGDFVNVWSDVGVFKVRKADATVAGKEAHGFVLAGFAAAATATVYFEGNNTQVAGATPGPVYLSTTAGGFTSTPPAAAGNIVQKIGVAVAATRINVECAQHYVLA